MSYIGHQCTRCGHHDLWRLDQNRTIRDTCPCGCRCTPGEPAVNPTWDQQGRPVDHVVEPGGKVGPLVTCDCAGCKALYEQSTDKEIS